MVWTVDGASGIFLTVKGYYYVLVYVEEQCSAGKDDVDATLYKLGIYALQLDLFLELQPFQQLNA